MPMSKTSLKPNTKKEKLKNTGVKLGLVFGSLLAGFIVLELLFAAFFPQMRSFLQPDPVIGTKHIPGLTVRQADSCLKITTRFNKEGMVDIDHELMKPEGTFRIAVLGDSYVEAMQNNFEDAFFRKLESKLKEAGKNVEVLSFGVGGFGTAQELLLLRDYALKYHPDLVIVSFFSLNDVRNNSFALEQNRDMPYAVLNDKSELVFEPFTISDAYQQTFYSSWRTLIFDHSHFIRFIYRMSNNIGWWRKVLAKFNFQNQAIGSKNFRADANLIYAKNPPDDWEKSWRVTESLLARMKQESESNGAKFLLFSLSNVDQLTEESFQELTKKYHGIEMERTKPEDRLHKISEQHKIDYVSALPTMEKLASENVKVHPECHGHWSVEAGDAAGALLKEYVLKNYIQ